jgi:hypothetical protein
VAKQANASPPVCFECRFECIIFSSSVFVACHSLANGNNHLQVRASFGDPDGAMVAFATSVIRDKVYV